MSTAKFDTWMNPDGTTNYKCRAWVNFDGTTTTPTIRASGNVSSVTRNGTGLYTVNFTTAMPDTSYGFSGTGGVVSGQAGSWGAYVSEVHNSGSLIRTTTSVRFFTAGWTAVNQDSYVCSIQIFR
jgi:hypothetical protein